MPPMPAPDNDPAPGQDGAVFERLRPRLTAISRRIVGSDAEAEDVVQDCFLKWMAADRAALATPAAWLTTVARHGAIDRLRARARDAQALSALALDAAAAATAPSPEDDLLRRADLADALARLFGRLSATERTALVLHDALDCAHADVAALLGIQPASARQHVSRARRRLHADAPAAPPDEHEEKRCRERVRRFQAAINGLDVPALAALLADEQPVSMLAAPPSPVVHPCVRPCVRPCTRAGANDARYAVARAA